MKRLAAALALLLLGAGGAGACERAKPPLETVRAIPASTWRDSAKFSFLIGRDYADAQVRMILMTALRSLRSFAELRASAQGWSSDYLLMTTVSQHVAKAEGLADRLTVLCNTLDRAAVLGEPFDQAAWLTELHGVTAQLDRTIASGAALRPRIKRYSDLILAAADHYERAPPPAIDELEIGPDPATVASGVAHIHGLWHALFADLEFARASLPSTADGSEATLAAVAVAAGALRKAASQAVAISANFIATEQFKSFAEGDYLYEACAAAENRPVRLANRYWPNAGVLTVLNDKIMVSPVGASSLLGLWRFHREGNGYWSVHLTAPIAVLLDLPDGAQNGAPLSASVKLSGSGRVTRISQLWRCYPSRAPGYVRFANATMGEGRAIDTYNNSSQAIMAGTGNYAGQFWQIVP